MQVEALTDLLRSVPEKRLRLVELAWDVLDSEGILDPWLKLALDSGNSVRT